MSDRDIAITEVSCLGQCDGAPAVRINDHSFRHVSAPQAEAIAISALGGSEIPAVDAEPRRTGLAADPYQNAEPYGALRKLAETRDFDGVIAQLKAAGLSGLGGAGFPTGVKWEAVRKTPATEKYVVCNADESEPGTIKDRFILGTPAASGDRRHDHRRPGDRRAQGDPVHPPRIRATGTSHRRRNPPLL